MVICTGRWFGCLATEQMMRGRGQHLCWARQPRNPHYMVRYLFYTSLYFTCICHNTLVLALLNATTIVYVYVRISNDGLCSLWSLFTAVTYINSDLFLSLNLYSLWSLNDASGCYIKLINKHNCAFKTTLTYIGWICQHILLPIFLCLSLT